MKTFVMDASVAAKWATPEIIELSPIQPIAFFAPTWRERSKWLSRIYSGSQVGSFLWKAAKRRVITFALAQRALEAMLNRDFPTVPSRAFLPQAFKIACDFDRTIYDSTYVAMAAATGRYLITADERLVNALGSRFPVRWLGAF